jgi:hypothetical protein
VLVPTKIFRYLSQTDILLIWGLIFCYSQCIVVLFYRIFNIVILFFRIFNAGTYLLYVFINSNVLVFINTTLQAHTHTHKHTHKALTHSHAHCKYELNGLSCDNEICFQAHPPSLSMYMLKNLLTQKSLHTENYCSQQSLRAYQELNCIYSVKNKVF